MKSDQCFHGQHFDCYDTKCACICHPEDFDEAERDDQNREYREGEMINDVIEEDTTT